MKIAATIKLITTNEGGRQNPIYSGYRPSLFRFDKYSDCVIMIIGKSCINPGEYGDVEIETLYPEKLSDAVVGESFNITEGTKVIANGIITGIKKNIR